MKPGKSLIVNSSENERKGKRDFIEAVELLKITALDEDIFDRFQLPSFLPYGWLDTSLFPHERNPTGTTVEIKAINGEKAAYFSLTNISDRGFDLEWLTVESSYRNQGLGTAIMTLLVCIADIKGLHIRLKAYPTERTEDNLDARNELINFYEQFGFKLDHIDAESGYSYDEEGEETDEVDELELDGDAVMSREPQN